MTEVIYYSDSISKVVAVFAIECAIVFGFIVFLIFCCIGKIFCYKDVTVKDKDVFTFKKYLSKNKISVVQMETLYEPNTTETNDELKTKSKSTEIKLYKYIFGNSINKVKKSPTKSIDIKEKIKPKNNSSSLLELCSTTDIKCGAQQETINCVIDVEEKIDDIIEVNETNKAEEKTNETIDDVKNCDVLLNKENKELDVEHGLGAKKIYFTNLIIWTK